jgi:paraquat-inducible protein A
MPLIACPGCDLLQQLPPVAPGDKACCARCGQVLAKATVNSMNRCLALTIAAAILLFVANLTPLMELSVHGRTASTTILGGAIEMWNQGQHITAVVVAFCAMIAPIAYVLSMLVILVVAHDELPPQWLSEVLRWARYLQIWSFHEVMLLGMLVALVKIAELARVEVGVGIYSVGALTLLFPAIATQFNARELWERIEWAAARSPDVPPNNAAVAALVK